MLYREIIAVCSQIHTKHINAQCGQNVELLNVKLVAHIVTTGLCKRTAQRSAAVCYLKISAQFNRTVQRLNRSIETQPLFWSKQVMKVGSRGGGGGGGGVVGKVGWRRSENMKSCQYKSLFVSFLRIIGALSFYALCVCAGQCRRPDRPNKRLSHANQHPSGRLAQPFGSLPVAGGIRATSLPLY